MVDTNMQLAILNNEKSDNITKLTFVKGLKAVTETKPVATLTKKKSRKANNLGNWCMPEQPSGYIKNSRHNLL